ncbi:MAG: hypothetical protein Q8M17_05350 [Actinomycetota bacterium]|nr:hypothetical protein [Actinomycetota bacterium]
MRAARIGLSIGASLLAATAIAGNAGAATPPTPTFPASIWSAYRDAIIDSAVARPDEVVTNLLVLSPSDGRTQWKVIDGEQYLLVGQLRGAPFTGVDPGQKFQLPGDRWVSVPRDLAQACAAYKCRRMDDAALDLQLRQIVGLPPDADYDYIIRFWVKPSDMFRPCTDPRVTVRSCPEQVASGSAADPVPSTVGSTDLASFLWTQANYAWRLPSAFHPKAAVSCAVNWNTERCYGFPWTRLGYTYDWTPGAADHEGVTEFVAANGATAYLESFGKHRKYFPQR